jgi:hypothetical protein
MIATLYVVLIVCALIVGGCAGGILGKISTGKTNQGLAGVVFIACCFQLFGYIAIYNLKFNTGSNVPMALYIIVALITVTFAYSGARQGPA